MALARGASQLVLSAPSTSSSGWEQADRPQRARKLIAANPSRRSRVLRIMQEMGGQNVPRKKQGRTACQPAGVAVRPTAGSLSPDAATYELLRKKFGALLEGCPDLRVRDVMDSAETDTPEAEGPACHVTVLEPKQVQDKIWGQVREEALRDSQEEPALASYLYSTILSHSSLERALAFHLSNKLSSSTLLNTQLFNLVVDILEADDIIQDAIRADLQAVRSRDPACTSYCHCLLNFKGFLACQAHRVAHRLWNQGRTCLSLAIQSRVSEVFQVDIHPAAKLGKGLLFDHATGVVIGETSRVDDNVSILHHVTLGGSGTAAGPRHPHICEGVLIGAGATILGQVVIGEGAKIGAGSVVLADIPAHCTAVGNPARLLGGKENPKKLQDVPSESMDQVSFIREWSDYVI